MITIDDFIVARRFRKEICPDAIVDDTIKYPRPVVLCPHGIGIDFTISELEYSDEEDWRTMWWTHWRERYLDDLLC